MEIIKISLKSLVKLDNITLCLIDFDSLKSDYSILINKSKNLGQKVGVLFTVSNNEQIDNIIELFERLKTDYFFILEEDVLNISIESFVNELLIPLGVTNVVCEPNYHFIYNKKIDSDSLSYYEEFDTYVCD